LRPPAPQHPPLPLPQTISPNPNHPQLTLYPTPIPSTPSQPIPEPTPFRVIARLA
jgi:hypothetical protein